MDKSKIGLKLEKISFICMPCEYKIKNLGNSKINVSTNKNTNVTIEKFQDSCKT